MSRNILVVGASGYIGSHLVPNLLNLGHHVTATGRNLKLLEKRGWGNIDNLELVELDLELEQDLTDLFINIDTVYFLVHGMNHGHDFIEFELDCARQFSHYLGLSAVQHVVYLGALQSQTSSSKHLIARKETGNILRDSGKCITELRAGIIIGPGSAAFEVMQDFVYHLPIMLTPSWVTSHNSPIALRNLLYYLTELIECPPDHNLILDVAGPEQMTYKDQMVRLSKVHGKTIRVIPLKWLSPKMATYWLRFITSVPTNIARALIGGLSCDLLADGSELQRRIPQHLISYEEAIQEALAMNTDVVNSEIWGFDPDALLRWQTGYGYFPKQAGYTLKTDASCEDLWRQVQLVGGEEGYFYANGLWRIREWMDAMIGGNALKRYRRDPQQLQLGDHIDSWKVISLEKNHFLSLLFGMKAPGLGRLEFTIEDCGDHRTIDIRAWWHPKGFMGLLYWFAMMPAHLFIFRGMTHALVKRCKAKIQQGNIETK
ncbi:SDR family oxidoreductase [Photobacterium iliopiscarium]|uniref:SDR family oxidoreductase n=1 Tax=Photobacterium iliopiscarium TaxID=56192 RepID=UPI001E583BBA|nr:SDR family oxidoreductase [Photobacterium iliopiscarium]MCD9466413.1 NAD(P)-dependent oxidoreductase [Photobacterium iliopiscarium]MCD9486221.1 DUF2867 domain-containing protein [Photobacterium iliopiscarium]MCF2244707.1 DUF2867 domain-containing protein [Photobacterium iliopiscarium]